MTDQSEVSSIGNYLDIIKEACSITCEPDSHSNWILTEIKHQIKENTKSGDERKFFYNTRLASITTPFRYDTVYHTTIIDKCGQTTSFKMTTRMKSTTPHKFTTPLGLTTLK